MVSPDKVYSEAKKRENFKFRDYLMEEHKR